MGNYTREEILQMVEEEDVEFIRLQFTDMYGAIKNIAVTTRELPRALDNEYVVDSSYIAGIAGEKEPDMYLHPDYNTFTILPWRPQQGKVARLLCDIYRSDGTPLEKSPRYILKQVVEMAAKEGYVCEVDPECEFFLFHTDDNGVPTTLTHEKAGYLDISPLDLGENARRDMVLNLEDMGYEIESSHHETAPAQHEIDFKFSGANEMADCVMTFKMAVRTIAKRHGLHATFMPKPRAEVNGSGMHIHFALYKDGKNIFTDTSAEDGLSKEAYHFMAGIIQHIKGLTLINNPIINSYKRLVPGYNAPVDITWSRTNRTPLIRLTNVGTIGSRVILRSPDGASNPYLVLAGCLAAGLEGIRKELEPPVCMDDVSEEDKVKFDILPRNLREAIRAFEEDEFLQQVIGKTLSQIIINEKTDEWEEFSRQVTAWEVEKYLDRV